MSVNMKRSYHVYNVGQHNSISASIQHQLPMLLQHTNYSARKHNSISNTTVQSNTNPFSQYVMNISHQRRITLLVPTKSYSQYTRLPSFHRKHAKTDETLDSSCQEKEDQPDSPAISYMQEQQNV